MKRLVLLMMLVWVTGCQPVGNPEAFSPTETLTAAPSKASSPSPSSTPLPLAAHTQTVTPQPTASPTSTLPPTVTPTATPDTRLIPYYWRDWDIVPALSPTARDILRAAVENPNLDARAFSKIGDCQMTSDTFLGGYANGQYATPEEFAGAVAWFSASMVLESVTAERGLGISSVLNPMFGRPAGYDQCLVNETPLDCELRIHRPALVLIGMGTNWIPNAEISFEEYLRTAVERVLETGALPILATKADNVEENWKLNEAIARVAYDYDVPLVNVWRAVQYLPNHGLERKVYLTPDGWMRRNYVWLATLENVRVEMEKYSR